VSSSDTPTIWSEIDLAVVDVEGNGQQPPGLVELAVVPIVRGVIGEPTSWLLRPAEPIKHFATRIHGITNQDVADAPTLATVRDEVRATLAGRAVVAHNAHVDVSVLTRELGDWQPPEVFDTLKLARRLLPGRASYKLGALVEEFTLDQGLPDGLVPHRATYDALVAARLFVRLMTGASGDALTLGELRGEPVPGATDDALF
jgi:exodeoxyribonuclease X